MVIALFTRRRSSLKWLGASALAAMLPVGKVQAANRPALMLATEHTPSFAGGDAWVSEKYDGVRAYWDGRQLLTRGGHRIEAPAWFTAGWPAFALDGELWAGRGRFAEAVSTARRESPDDAAWRGLRYMVFDLPAQGGRFEARYAALLAAVQTMQQAWVQPVLQSPAPDAAGLQALLADTTRAGGEGLMLHRASALYQAGRSADLVKLKQYQDAEARVLSHVAGQGRLQGRTGALWVEWRATEGAKAHRFKLGSGFTDAERADPPAVGSWVTFRYRGLTAQGVPRFASYLRPAAPMNW
ncbi:DNA ligase [Rhodoferax sp. TBRC 17198]|uniref:DNA ligase n=1 Tax=Rhodoferax potami TaxID=3068338 RepID=UPI0028BE1A96|nr:DNA ligase [Rhodoferax sp. TBRC 17198]MDT7523810.1 DNA ligase [Rhodoferax sp. TBRC 17198]